MKTKFLPAIILMTASLSLAKAEGGTPAGEGHGEGLSNQKVVVNNYYYLNGYEYASRITRFHRSFVSFDFYSPMYTEIYWYRYKPYTWGVSIYDDWYYYGAVATRNAWRSGFGGSYWWGYDPWRDYNPWMGYGWSSWYSPGVSFSVNFYLGRPYYHYPMAWNRWHHQNYRSFSGPVNIVNNNTYNYYYGSQRRDSRQSPPTGYNPSHPYNTGDRPGYTVTGGRSSVSRSAPPVSTGGRTQANTSGDGNSDRPAGGNASGNAGNQSDRNNSNNGNNGNTGNNGLRMGQFRRGVAQPANPDDNGLPRANNPNVNDRTDPGREQGNSSNSRQQGNSANNAGQQGNSANNAGQQGNVTQGNRRQSTGVDRAPAGSSQGQQTQGTVRSTTQGTVRRTTQSTVRTTTQRSIPARRQEKAETSSKSQKTVKQDKKGTTTKTTGKKNESEKSSSSKRRNM